MKSNSWTLDLMKLVLQNEPATLLGDAKGLIGSDTVGNIYVALHVSDPGRAGSQTTAEATFSGYARAAIPRTKAWWTVELIDAEFGPVRISNAALIAFKECTGGKNRITYASVGTSGTGPGKILYSGKLTQEMPVEPGIIVEFKPGDVSFTES